MFLWNTKILFLLWKCYRYKVNILLYVCTNEFSNEFVFFYRLRIHSNTKSWFLHTSDLDSGHVTMSVQPELKFQPSTEVSVVLKIDVYILKSSRRVLSLYCFRHFKIPFRVVWKFHDEFLCEILETRNDKLYSAKLRHLSCNLLTRSTGQFKNRSARTNHPNQNSLSFAQNRTVLPHVSVSILQERRNTTDSVAFEASDDSAD